MSSTLSTKTLVRLNYSLLAFNALVFLPLAAVVVFFQ